MATTGLVGRHDSGVRPTRIAAVSYLNTAPLIEGLEPCRDAVVTADVPARLLGALLEERADVALAPIMDVLTAPARLVVLPVGCIATDGPARSVVLFSRCPVGRIGRVLTDPESRSSAALCEVLLRRRFGSDAVVERGQAPIVRDDGSVGEAVDAVLLIGDKVERRPPAAEAFPHRLDLGAEWKAWTSLPFVFAAWVCLADRIDEPVVARACGLLDRQRRRNAMRLGWIAARRARGHGWGISDAAEYLMDLIEYDLTPAHRAGVQRFAEEARRLGLARGSAPILFAEDVAAACPGSAP